MAEAATSPDPYSWWIGKPVQLRVGAPGRWVAGAVLEAGHSILWDLHNNPQWYEADYDEADGSARVIELQVGAEPLTVDMYLSGPAGVLPEVILGRALEC